MADTTTQIDIIIHAFVKDLNVLVRQAALDAVASALGGAAAAPKRGPGRPRKTEAPRVSAPSGRGRRTVGGKRSPAALNRTTERVRDHVATHAGHGVEAIGKALGLKTAQLALPVKKLLDSKHITRKGVKRATRYFPGANIKSAIPASSSGGRPKKK